MWSDPVWLLAAVGFAALSVSERLTPWVEGLGVAALGAGAWIVAGRVRALQRLLTRWGGGLLLALFAAVAGEFWLRRPDLITSAAAFVAGALTLKVLGGRSPADREQTLGLATLALLASSGASTPWFLVPFLAYVLLAPWALLSLVADRAAPGSRRTSPRRLSLLAAGLSLLGGGIFFFLFPRFPGFGLGGWARVPGLSERVEFGSLGRLKGGARVAFRAETGTPLPEAALYWRAATFERFDGRTWQSALPHTLGHADPSGVVRVAPARPADPWVVEDVSLDPAATRGLPLVGQAVTLAAGVPLVAVRADGSIERLDAPERRLRYRVWAQLSPTVPDDRRLEASPDLSRALLEVPGPLAAPVRALAHAWTRGSFGRPAEARALLRRLREGYRYSLDVAEPATDPVGTFLFHTKVGYCEHFASAMVLLLRSLGIPARLATGYLGGEWMRMGGYYLLRERNAHSWVEAQLERGGPWTPLDPTPAALGSFQGGWIDEVNDALDRVEEWWVRRVVGYAPMDQHNLWKGFALGPRAVWTWLSAGRTSPPPGGEGALEEGVRQGWTLAGGAALAVALLALLGIGRRRRRASRSATAYAAALEILGRRGWPRRPSEAPLAYAARIRGAAPAFAEPLEELTTLYVGVRFGGRPGDDARARRLLRRVARTRRAGSAR